MPEERKYTEAQKQSAKKWDAANLDRISIALPKGRKDAIKAHAGNRGESVNSFIGRAITEAIEHDARPQGTEIVYLAQDTAQAAQEAAQAAGEDITEFLSRAVDTQAAQDREGGKT